MPTTPDPIEGWTFTCEWKTDKQADGLKWTARSADATLAWLEPDGLHVTDDADMYDHGSLFTVPLAVVDALRRLEREQGFEQEQEIRNFGSTERAHKRAKEAVASGLLTKEQAFELWSRGYFEPMDSTLRTAGKT
jgi:hypothetical protein